MAEKKAKSEKPGKPEKKEGILKSAAKALGTAAGTVAHTLGVHGDGTAAPAPPKPKRGRLVKKGKSRLPRKVKKAQKKATAKNGAPSPS